MNIKQHFYHAPGFPAEPDLHALSKHSIVEARNKEERLQDFYADPYKDGTEQWYLALKTYEYLRAYKKELQKRKNKFQEGILHEQNICFLFKALFYTGVLPRRVTYEIVDGEKKDIPEHLQPIENLFCVIHFHDIDEDFADSSPEDMIKYLSYVVTHDMTLDNQHKRMYLDRIEAFPDMMRAMTFGRKTRDENRRIITVPTHNGDPQIYFDAIETNWATAIVKPGDRLRGIVDRYGPVPNIFTLEQQKKYLAETRDLFYYRQIVENMQIRYPELKEAFAIINARMNVAYRALDMLVSFHPDNKESLERKTGRPETARLDIKNFLPVALKIQDYVDDDADDMTDLLINLEYVSARRPTLQGITGQLRDQLAEFMPHLEQQPSLHSMFIPEKAVLSPAFR